MLASETEQAFYSPALCALAVDDSFKVAFLRTCMMLDGQLERGHPTRITLKLDEKVIVIRVPVSGNTLSRERLQI
jgi:hypothetical protein